MSATSNPAKPVLRVGLPLRQPARGDVCPFRKGGVHVSGSSRSYKPGVDDPELQVRLLRAQGDQPLRGARVSRLRPHGGRLDRGKQLGRDVAVRTDFQQGEQQSHAVVLVVPEDSPIRILKDLEGKRVATEALNLTRKFFERNGVKAEIEFSWGATEVKVPDLVDAIVDVPETGSSLRANKLRIVETLMVSSPQFIANKAAYADAWKREKMDRLVLLLKGGPTPPATKWA